MGAGCVRTDFLLLSSVMLNMKSQLVPSSLASGYSAPIYHKMFGLPSTETDDKLQHVCTKFFSASSSIDQLNVDLLLERICADGLYDRDQSRWMDRSHFSDALLFLNSLTERSYAALSATAHASESCKRRIWVLDTPAESSSGQIRNHQVLMLVNHDSQGVAAVDDVHAIAEITSKDAAPDLMQVGIPFLVGHYGPFGLLIQHSVVHLVKYDRQGFITIPIDIHRHPRTLLGCISGLAARDSYTPGFPHIEPDSIQPGSIFSQWTKTTTHARIAAHPPRSSEHRTHIRLIGPPVFGSFDRSLLLDDFPFNRKLGVNDDSPPHDQARILDELKDVYGVPKIAGYRSMTVDSTIIHPERLLGSRSLTVENVVHTAEHLIAISFFASRKEFFGAMKSCLQSVYQCVVQ
jgi:hypothetical protein